MDSERCVSVLCQCTDSEGCVSVWAVSAVSVWTVKCVQVSSFVSLCLVLA